LINKTYRHRFPGIGQNAREQGQISIQRDDIGAVTGVGGRGIGRAIGASAYFVRLSDDSVQRGNMQA